MFKIGQKVVCVNPDIHNVLKKDEIYTVNDIGKCPCGCNKLLLYIKEAPELNKLCLVSHKDTGIHSGYWSVRFEPIINANWVDELLERLKSEIKQEEQLEILV